MYQEHPSFRKPTESTAMIWRYMNLAKFVSILDKKAMFFSHLNRLGDPYEAAFPEPDKAELRAFVQNDAAFKAVSENPDPDSMLNAIRTTNAHATVNTWFIGGHESDAMWKLYTSRDEGIAIQSKFGQLCGAFGGITRPIYIGLVNYIDYKVDKAYGADERGAPDPFLYVLHKRKSFEHERELRAVTRLPLSSPELSEGVILIVGEGMYVPVDLNLLIDKVYVSPTSPRWLLELVRSLLKKYGVEKPVEQSKLYTIPSVE